MKSDERAPATGVVLAAVAGWVDTLGFVALFGVFTAHVTGNFVLIGSEMVQRSSDVAPKLLVFPAFVLGVLAAGSLHSSLQARGRASHVPLLLLQALALTGFLLAGLVAAPILPDHTTDALPLAAISCAAFAMGVQNAQSRLALAALGPTTVMTGNVTQLVLEAVSAARDSGPERQAALIRVMKLLGPVLSFGAAAVAGAFAFRALSFWALLVPITMLCTVAAKG